MSTIAISLAIGAAVAGLAALALGLCRAAALPTPDDQYAARRAAEQEDLS